MGRHILSIFVVFCMISSLRGQWEILNQGISEHLSSVYFLDENTGWMLTRNGQLMKPDDKGLTWIPVQMNENWYLREIQFITETDGWAKGSLENLDGYFLLKTNDGGHNWIIADRQESIWIHDFQVVNDSVVYTGMDRCIKKTTDGGETWNEILPLTESYSNEVSFWDARTGIVRSSVDDNDYNQHLIYTTRDGGATWATDSLTYFDSVYDIRFGRDSVAYFLGEIHEPVRQTYLCRSENMLTTWYVVYEHSSIQTYSILSNEHLYVAAEDTLGTVTLLKSTDAGSSWDSLFTLTNWNVSNIQFDEEGDGFVLCGIWGRGVSRYMFLSNQLYPGQWVFKRFSYDIQDVSFVDQNYGIIIGGYSFSHGPTGGDIFSTNDGGSTWSPLPGVPGWPMKCQFIDNHTGYIMMSGLYSWEVYKTSDAGITWNVLYNGFNFSGHDILVTADEEIWAAGRFFVDDSSGAGILHSPDGGSSWNIVYKYFDTAELWYSQYALHRINGTLWSVGENGLILKFTEQDQWQPMTAVTDLPLHKVFFSDEQHGWIAGGYHNWSENRLILLRTTDGGAN